MELGTVKTPPAGGAPRAELTDLALAEMAAAGDAGARRALLGRVLTRVRTTIRYVSGDDRDQDDLVQLALVQILSSARTFRGESTLAAWADRIAVRTALRQLARRRRKEQLVAFEEAPEAGPIDTGDEHARLAMRRRLAVHLGALSPERRTVVALRLVHGYGIDEIAAMTETGRNTVRDRLAHGRRELAKRLERDPAFGRWVGAVRS
jgi:RNA polymerase sigma-70 factor (ECF subfamily)